MNFVIGASIYLYYGFRRSEDTSRTRQLGACADGYGSSCLDHPWTVRVIHNAVDVVFSQMESNHRVRRPRVSAALQNDRHRFAIHFAHSHLPGLRPPIVISKIWRIDKFSPQPTATLQPTI